MKSTAVIRPVYRSIEEARTLVAAWRSSGEGQESWCRKQGIQRSALSSYLRRVGDRFPPRLPERGSPFIPVVVRAGAPTAAESATGFQPVVEFPGGIRVTGLPISGVAALVQALRGMAP